MFQNNQADDYHVFVTDSEWMRELGLATFTTGTLYDWWYHRGRGNRFINRPLVLGGTNKTPYHPFFSHLTMSVVPRTPVWRFTGLNKGKYKDMAFDSSWNYTDGRPVDEKKPWYNASYDAADADLSAFDGSKFVAGSAGGLWGGVGLLSPPRLGGDPDPTDAGLGTDTNSPTNIIACNDWLRDWEVKAPDKTDQTMWSVTDLAAYRFIQDIKTSKSGCLIYPVSMTFDVAPGQTFSDGAGGLVPAYKTEEFTIKLFLYDEKSVRKSGRTAILTSTKHAAVPRDAMGRVGKKEDGEIDDVDGTDPSNKVQGDIDLTLNTTTGEWYSGSKQMLARISQEVPAADWECTTDDLRQMETIEILNDPNDPRHLVMGTGLAMPISMQNGNPMQWTPNYIDPKDCRQDGREKFTVIVHNPDPDRSFPKDKVVLLNQIDGGVWMPMEFGEGPPTGTDAIEGNFEGRWDFIYFATSLEYFFRDGNNNVITPEQAERAFHVQYYNNGSNGATLNWNIIPADNPHLSIKGATPFLGSDAYHQFSSFDFMDDNVAGTRGPMRSLGATVYGKDPLGGNTTVAPENTGPFFGCVFPNGYSAGGGDRIGANTYNASRNWQVLGLQPRSAVRGRFFNAAGIPSIGAAGAPHMAFKDGANGMDLTRHAYKESPGDADGNIIPMFADVAQGNFDVPHLPADIALNASPSGENGRPLTNLNSITSAVHGLHWGQTTQTLLRDGYWPFSKNWLYKAKYWDGSKPSTISYNSTAGQPFTGSGAYDDSAFDFKPKVNNKIQFRPLKMEVYASLVDDGKTTAHNRENVWHYARNKMDDDGMPASVISRDRERGLAGGWSAKNPLYGDGEMDQQSSPSPADEPMWGLKFNVDYPLSLFATNDPSDMFSDRDSWRQDIDGGQAWRHSFTEPAGAVGVIGAIATVSAADHVNFTTQQSIGTDADYGGTVGGVSFGDFQILGPKTNWNATWGGGSLDYDNFHTTDLSVRIYQAWPRDQTIYDPRYFAVHHFNDGVKLSDLLGEVKEDLTDTDGDGLKDHVIARAESTVDIREPTAVLLSDQLTVGSSTPTSAADGNVVYKDTISTQQTPILPTGMWNINPIRRGKLLPFRYSYKAITIPWPESLTVFGITVFPLKLLSGAGVYHSGSLPQGSLGSNYIDDPNTDGEEPKLLTAHDIKLVVQNLGKDYQIGDRFTVLGSDCLLEVLTVDDYTNNAGQTYKNSIKEFKVTDLGTYLDHPNLMPVYEDDTLTVPKPIHSFSQGAAKIEPLNSSSAAGTGFAAYVVSGKVSTLIGTDDKPKIATNEDFYQLSLPASHVEKTSREHDQMVVGNRSVDADIDPDKVSSDGMYDLFFHFHNDISHTWLSKGDWGTYANNEDQYIDLTINPV